MAEDLIDRHVIEGLHPCKDAFDLGVDKYGDRKVTKRQFMGLKHVSHRDKVWVAFRLMPKNNIRFAAADIAELVLPIYEAKYPGDLRPRRAIKAARTVPLDRSDDAADDAYAAYAAADASAASAAAYAASYAASADAAASTFAAYAAASAAGSTIEKKIRTIIIKYWK